MHHFFTEPCQIGDETIRIVGPDVNHMKNVLRMKPGEEVLVSDGAGRDYLCCVEQLGAEEVLVSIQEELKESRELPLEQECMRRPSCVSASWKSMFTVKAGSWMWGQEAVFLGSQP